MNHHGSQEEFTSISIVQGDSLRVNSDPYNHRTGSCSLIALGDFKAVNYGSRVLAQRLATRLLITSRLVPMFDKAVMFDSSSRYALGWGKMDYNGIQQLRL